MPWVTYKEADAMAGVKEALEMGIPPVDIVTKACP
jgi:hypothetical protein